MTLAYTALLAYTLLMLGLVQKDGGPDLPGLACVSLAWIVAVVGLLFSGRETRSPSRLGLLVALLVVLVVQAIFVANRVRFGHVDTKLGGVSLLPFNLWIAGTIFLALLWFTPWLARWRIFLAIALSFGIGCWAIHGWHEDDRQKGFAWTIDVTYMQQAAAKELLAGRNPYTALYENIYQDTAFYGEKTIRDGKIVSFPYTPATLGLDLLGYGLGDIRWGHLLVLAGASVFLVLAARVAGLPAGHPAELAVLLLWLHPSTGKILVSGWTEPLLFCAGMFCLWALLGPRGWGRSLGVGLLLSAKQIAPLWLPSLAMSGRLTWRAFLGGSLLALAVVMPFVLWDPVGFWQGVFVFHLGSPFRSDCISIPAQVFEWTGYQTPGWIAFVAVAVVFALHAWVRRPSLAQATFAGALAFMTFFFFGKAAHLNYYWFVEALLLATIPLAVAETLKSPTAVTDNSNTTAP